MKKILIVFILILAPYFLFAQNLRTILPMSSPVYGLIDNIYYEMGMAQPETARPWSYEELSSRIKNVEYDKLSQAGKKAYDYILELLGWDQALVKDEFFTFDSSIILSPEGFYHFELGDSLDKDAEAYEWNYGYEERKSFLKAPLEFWYDESLYMLINIEAKEERQTVTSPDTPDVADNHFNILFDDASPRLDLYFPFRAALSTGGAWWDVFFGRDNLSWGNGVSGNLVLSDYSDFYDFIELKTRSRLFTFTSVYSVMDSYLPDEDRFDGEINPYSAFMGHRMEARFWDEKIQVAVTEAVTFANSLPEIIRDLNYLMVFHSWTIPERTNSILSLDFSINPWRYMNVYGQIAMDEVATEYESERDGGGGPPIFGYLAGIKGAYPLYKAYLSLALEWAYTDPWLYNRRAAPYFYNTRRYWSLVTDSFEYETKPIGYQYGSDAIVWYWQAEYSLPGLYSFGSDITYLTKGEKSIADVWDPDEEDVTPTGIAEKSWIFHLFGEYCLFPFLSFNGDFYFSTIDNYDHIEGESRQDIEISASVTYTL